MTSTNKLSLLTVSQSVSADYCRRRFFRYEKKTFIAPAKVRTKRDGINGPFQCLLSDRNLLQPLPLNIGGLISKLPTFQCRLSLERFSLRCDSDVGKEKGSPRPLLKVLPFKRILLTRPMTDTHYDKRPLVLKRDPTRS